MKTFKLLILAILLFSATIACGLGAEPTITPTPPPTATDTPTPLPPTATNTPTPIPPTATPTPIPSPTLSPTPAVVYLVQPPPADGGPCANVFYPLIEGNQWVYLHKYTDGEDQIGLTVAEVNDTGGADSTAHVQSMAWSVGVTNTSTILCDQGAILSIPESLIGAFLVDASGGLSITHQSGVFVPAYETFLAANWDLSWEGHYIANGSFEAVAEGETYIATLENSPVDISWHTPGAGELIFEPVDISLGNYPKAIKLFREITMKLSLQLSAEGSTFKLPATLKAKQTLWFEPNTGLLKQQVDEVTVTWLAGTYPLEFVDTIELLEFRPAKE